MVLLPGPAGAAGAAAFLPEGCSLDSSFFDAAAVFPSPSGIFGHGLMGQRVERLEGSLAALEAVVHSQDSQSAQLLAELRAELRQSQKFGSELHAAQRLLQEEWWRAAGAAGVAAQTQQAATARHSYALPCGDSPPTCAGSPPSFGSAGLSLGFSSFSEGGAAAAAAGGGCDDLAARLQRMVHALGTVAGSPADADGGSGGSSTPPLVGRAAALLEGGSASPPPGLLRAAGPTTKPPRPPFSSPPPAGNRDREKEAALSRVSTSSATAPPTQAVYKVSNAQDVQLSAVQTLQETALVSMRETEVRFADHKEFLDRIAGQVVGFVENLAVLTDCVAASTGTIAGLEDRLNLLGAGVAAQTVTESGPRLERLEAAARQGEVQFATIIRQLQELSDSASGCSVGMGEAARPPSLLPLLSQSHHHPGAAAPSSCSSFVLSGEPLRTLRRRVDAVESANLSTAEQLAGLARQLAAHALGCKPPSLLHVAPDFYVKPGLAPSSEEMKMLAHDALPSFGGWGGSGGARGSLLVSIGGGS